MKLVFENPAARGKVTRMAALPGARLEHGTEVEVPDGLVAACLRSGQFRVPDGTIEEAMRYPTAQPRGRRSNRGRGRRSEERI